MKKLLLLLVTAIFAVNLFAQDVLLSENLIKKFNAAKANALKKGTRPHNHLWLTPLLTKAKLNWKKLTPQAKALFQPYSDRPVLPDELTYTQGFFVFHYTITGDDNVKVDATDENQNNVPDYVEKMADRIVNKVAAKDHNTLGMAVPPDDFEKGGDGNYDVYLADAGEGTYGYVAPEDSIGDNTYSEGISEKYSYSSYMVLRNNYNGFTNPDTAISVTIAHEYQHAIQMGYNVYLSTPVKEMCATWAEDYNFDGYGDNLQYLSTLFTQPDVALNLTNDEAGEGSLSNYWYSSFLFAKYMTEQKGAEVIKKMYEKVGAHNWAETDDVELTTLGYLDDVLKADYNSDITNMYRDFCISNVLLTSNSFYAPYTYEHAAQYSEYATKHEFGLLYESTLSFPSEFSSSANGNGRLMRFSADYFNVEIPNEASKITLKPDADKSVTMVLLKIKSNDNSLELSSPEIVGNEQSINISPEGYSAYSLIVYRVDPVNDTLSAQYTLVTDLGTKISEINASNISVYPSPANNNITIETTNSQSVSKVELVNLLGASVYAEEFSENSTKKSISTNSIPSGTYFMKLSNGNKISTKKIVILH